MAKDPRAILIITATRIGDAVLSSGLIKALHDQYPKARFTIVAGPVAAPLFADVPNLDRVIAFSKQKDGGHWFALWRAARGQNWDLVVDGRGSAIAYFLMAKRRVIHRKSGRIEHKVVEAARLLGLQDQPPMPFLFTSSHTEAKARALIANLDTPVVAMGPAANWMGKAWPSERFAKVAQALLGPDGPMPSGRLLILGGPGDEAASLALQKGLPADRWIDLTGKADLLTVFAALKHARLFVGNDSGLMHLAAAAGAPTLGLFGPSDDRLYGPWGALGQVLRGPRSLAEIKALDPSLNQPVCHMLDLSEEAVVEAAKALYERTQSTTRSRDNRP
jgi:ADP-heptose:LPS heptosyltransferase